MYCKVQMSKDSEEDVFFNSEITLLQKRYCLINNVKFQQFSIVYPQFKSVGKG